MGKGLGQKGGVGRALRLTGFGLVVLLAGMGLDGHAALAQQGRPAPKADDSAAALSGRLDRLEQQFSNLQVMVGTLESLVRARPAQALPQESANGQGGGNGNGGAGASGGGNGQTAQINAMETQIQALTNQLQDVTSQLQQLQSRMSGAPQPQMQSAPSPQQSQPLGRQGALAVPSNTQQASAGQPLQNQQTAFGTMSVSTSADGGAGPGGSGASAMNGGQRARQAADSDDRAGLDGAAAGYGEGSNYYGQNNANGGGAQLASLQASSGARQLYDQGYGDMLQKNYAGAQVAFQKLVDGYPVDPLAPDAQYWLGESYYARGLYKQAAEAFLTGYRSYKTSKNAPESLLKLGMSLARLGHKSAACSTYGQLNREYPSAPSDVRNQLTIESRKAGCRG